MCLHVQELVLEIAEWLSEDTQALYNLCLVNHTCFFLAARLLWRNPFGVGKISSRLHLKILRQVLLFANNEDRQNVDQILKQWSTRTSELPVRSGPPALPYLNFIRTLDVEGLNILIYHWLNTLNPQKDYRRETTRHGFDLSLVLCKLVVSHSSQIDCVNFTLKCKYDDVNLFTLPNANMSFRHLKRITCSGNYSKRLLLASANKLLLNLEHIKVSLANNDDEELAKLVQRQRKLKSLEITGCNKSGTCNIIRALELSSSLIS